MSPLHGSLASAAGTHPPPKQRSKYRAERRHLGRGEIISILAIGRDRRWLELHAEVVLRHAKAIRDLGVLHSTVYEWKCLSCDLAELLHRKLALQSQPFMLGSGAAVIDMGCHDGLELVLFLPVKQVLIQETRTPALFLEVAM